MPQATQSQAKVLVVDDDPLLSDLLVRELSKQFSILYAPSGEDALKTLETQKPDVILLDIMLPGVDGFEVLRRIKANPETASVPVVILSNLGQPSDLKRGKELGAEQFIVKVSLTLGEVVSLVQSIIAGKKPSAV